MCNVGGVQWFYVSHTNCINIHISQMKWISWYGKFRIISNLPEDNANEQMPQNHQIVLVYKLNACEYQCMISISSCNMGIFGELEKKPCAKP